MTKRMQPTPAQRRVLEKMAGRATLFVHLRTGAARSGFLRYANGMCVDVHHAVLLGLRTSGFVCPVAGERYLHSNEYQLTPMGIDALALAKGVAGRAALENE